MVTVRLLEGKVWRRRRISNHSDKEHELKPPGIHPWPKLVTKCQLKCRSFTELSWKKHLIHFYVYPYITFVIYISIKRTWSCVICVHSVVVLLEVGGETLRGSCGLWGRGTEKNDKRSPHCFARPQIPSQNELQARREDIFGYSCNVSKLVPICASKR